MLPASIGARRRARHTARSVSQENVELVHAGLDALNRGDWDAVLELLDPEVEWETTGQFVEGGVYRGREGGPRVPRGAR